MAVALAEPTERDLRGAVSLLGSLAEQSEDCRSFVTAALEQLTAIVPSDLTTLSICDLKRARRHVVGRAGETLSEADRAAFDQHFRNHPWVGFHGAHRGGPTQRICDCMAASRSRKSALHADYYRRIGINFVMALPLRIDNDHVISVVFDRGHRDFRDAERAALDAIRLPLAAFYRKLVAPEATGFGLNSIGDQAAGNGWQMMRVSTTGCILDASADALLLRRRCFPREATGRAPYLPALLAEWFSRIRCWGLDRPANFLMKRERLDLRTEHLRELPLTEREREILVLVATGKTNAEIGIILAISARTVQNHLEHIVQKLGVETRTLAAADHQSAATPITTYTPASVFVVRCAGRRVPPCPTKQETSKAEVLFRSDHRGILECEPQRRLRY